MTPDPHTTTGPPPPAEAEAEALLDAPLPPLQLPPGAPPEALPRRPNRIPELRGGFAFQAGTPPPELPPVLPYEWTSADGRTAVLQVPGVAPPDRTLKLFFPSAESVIGKSVLLGGLRGVVGPDGVVAFDWDDVVAVGERVEHLFVGGGAAWRCLTPAAGDG